MQKLFFILLLCAVTLSGYGQNTVPTIGGPTSKVHAGGMLTADSCLKAPSDTVVSKHFDNTGNLAVVGGLLWYYTGAAWTTAGSGGGGGGNALVLTTEGSSGPATLSGDTLNIPNYVGSGGGSGTVENIEFVYPLTGGTVTTSGTVSIPAASSSTGGYLDSADWQAFNGKQDTGQCVKYTDSGAVYVTAHIFDSTTDYLLAVDAYTLELVDSTLNKKDSGVAFVTPTDLKAYATQEGLDDTAHGHLALINGKVNVADSGTAYITPTGLAQAATDTSGLSGRINEKQNFSDTATWDATKANLNTGLATKMNYSDSAGLSTRINAKQNFADTTTWDATKADLNAGLVTKVKYSDSGTVYRTAYQSDTAKTRLTNAIAGKGIGSVTSVALVAGYGIVIGGTSPITTTGTFTATVDSNYQTTRARLQKIIDSLIARPTVREVVNTPTVTATYTVVVTDTRPMVVTITSLNATTTIAISGTPIQNQALFLQVRNNGTQQVLQWTGDFVAGTTSGIDVLPPLTAIANRWIFIQYNYNTTTGKWVLTGIVNGVP
jgi:hypothetical protein